MAGAYRRGEIDPATFGVFGTQNWGAAEIRGNAVKDLAALNKVEMLPGMSGVDSQKLTTAERARTTTTCWTGSPKCAAANDASALTGIDADPDLAGPTTLLC